MTSQTDLLGQIGATLLQVQKAEHVLKTCMTYFVRAGRLSWDEMLAREEKERKQSLGYFLGEMRKTIKIRKDVEESLLKFLRDRNVFVHNIFDVSNFALDTAEGMAIGLAFAKSVEKQASFVRGILTGYIRLMTGESKLTKGIVIGPGVTEEESYELLALTSLYGTQEGLFEDDEPIDEFRRD